MKSMLEQRKSIRNNDKVIVGAFIGGIIMTVVFTILSWTPTTKFKDIATVVLSSITILIGLFTALKVFRWHEVKRNDKGFEVAQSIVMNTYQIYIIVLNYSEYITGIRERLELNKGILIESIISDNKIFKEKYNGALVMKKSLSKWSIIIKKDNDLMRKMMELHFCQFKIIQNYCNDVDYDNGMREQKEMISNLNKEIEEYNKLSIDDIYDFNN